MRYCQLPSCGKLLERKDGEANTKFSQRKFCNLNCFHLSRRCGFEIICSCGRTKWVEPWMKNQGKGKFCSKECYYLSLKNRIEIKCPCGKNRLVNPYAIKIGGGKYCSRHCAKQFNQLGRNNHMYGCREKHPNWRGGITPLNHRIRTCSKYQIYISNSKELDDWRCQICNKKGGKIVTDHYPLSFAQILEINNIITFEDALNCEMLWDLDNSRTLCDDCHKKTDTYATPLFKHWEVTPFIGTEKFDIMGLVSEEDYYQSQPLQSL